MTVLNDKLQSSLFTTVNFQPQESPASAKFTTWAQQTKNALEILSSAIGNIWGLKNYLGFEYGTIPSIWGVLAKDYQNPGFIPPFPPLDPTKSITVKIVDENTSVNEVFLPIEPNETIALAFNGGNAASVFQNKVSQLTTDGEWKLDGKHITTYTQIVTGAGESITCTYRPTTSSGWSGTFNRCWAKLVYDNGTTYIEVHADPNDDDFMFRSPFQDSYQAAFATNPFFSGSLAEGSNLYDEVTRLPSYMTTVLPGSELPTGWIQLYSTYTKRIVQNIKFIYPYTSVDGNGVKRILIIEELPDSAIDLSAGSNDYNRDYHLLVAGYSISQALHDLIQKVATLSFLGSSHKELNGLLLTNPSKIRLSSGSPIVGNDHPHYLLRSGYVNASDPANEDNAMLGPIKLSRIDYDTTDTGDSYPLMFGDAGSIFFDVSEDKVSITGKGLLLNYESAIDANLIVGAKTAASLTDNISSKKIKADSILLRGTELYLPGHVVVESGIRWLVVGDADSGSDFISSPEASGLRGLRLGNTDTAFNASWVANTGEPSPYDERYLDIVFDITDITTSLVNMIDWDIIPGSVLWQSINNGSNALDSFGFTVQKITPKPYSTTITFRISISSTETPNQNGLDQIAVSGFSWNFIGFAQDV